MSHLRLVKNNTGLRLVTTKDSHVKHITVKNNGNKVVKVLLYMVLVSFIVYLSSTVSVSMKYDRCDNNDGSNLYQHVCQ